MKYLIHILSLKSQLLIKVSSFCLNLILGISDQIDSKKIKQFGQDLSIKIHL